MFGNCVRSICNQHQFRLLSNRQAASTYGKHDKQNYQWRWGCARITNTSIGHHLGQIIRINSTLGQINEHFVVASMQYRQHQWQWERQQQQTLSKQKLWFDIESNVFEPHCEWSEKKRSHQYQTVDKQLI